MKHVARIMLLLALASSVGCQPSISQQDLDFLATQKKPLTYKVVAKHLGGVEPGPGACYEYRIRGTNQKVEFWFSPPRPPSQTTATSIPVEIAVVAVRAEGAKPSIVWPPDLKGRDFDEAIASIWPKRQ